MPQKEGHRTEKHSFLEAQFVELAGAVLISLPIRITVLDLRFPWW
jgi:hypothetical protein